MRPGNREQGHAWTSCWGLRDHRVAAQDAVTRGGKFWKLYKRPGHRVIINADGDLIVRPTFIEASVQRRPGGQSVAHHLLTTYLKSYIAVIKSQFSTKAFQGGREVRAWCRQSCICCAAGLHQPSGMTIRLLQPRRAHGPGAGQDHGYSKTRTSRQ